MKYVFVLILLGFMSCKEITYRETQPKDKRALTEIPSSMRGKYLVIDENGVDKDTIYITKTGYHTRDEGMVDEDVLSDSLVLKKHKGYYFLNINQRPEWALRIIKQEKNGDLLIMSMEDKDFNSFLKKLGKEIKIDSIQLADEKLYQIDPTPKHLIGLINKKYF
ncbi:MAG TPA: hypothetical protein PKU83_03880, partial [Chryseolinea sp.]|nr:hypothetical protein [Chryseolinea sp.]